MAQKHNDAHGWAFLRRATKKSVKVTQVLTAFLQEQEDIPGGWADKKSI